MSHELRTPMNAILGMIDVALPKAADPTVKDCLQTAQESADLLLGPAQRSAWIRPRSSRANWNWNRPPSVCGGCWTRLTRVLCRAGQREGLASPAACPPTMPDAVVGDHMRLQQVLLNLAGNAIKFTERRGEVG